MFVYVNNPRNFQIFRNFQVKEGLRLAPELHGLHARISAQQRILLNTQREFWAPDLTLESDVNQRIAQAGVGQGGALAQDRTTWNLQLGLSFPLFAGGAKDANQSQALETLRQLQLEREAMVGRIEERIRATIFEAGASSASIRLSQEASYRRTDRIFSISSRPIFSWSSRYYQTSELPKCCTHREAQRSQRRL